MSVKDKTPFEGQHDLLCRAVCPNDNCTKYYFGKTARPEVERVKDLNGRGQFYPKESSPSGEEWLRYTKEWLQK